MPSASVDVIELRAVHVPSVAPSRLLDSPQLSLAPCWRAPVMQRARCGADADAGKRSACQDGDGGVHEDGHAAHEGEGAPHLFRTATELMLADRPLRADGAVLC